jgi:hypothetical protein
VEEIIPGERGGLGEGVCMCLLKEGGGGGGVWVCVKNLMAKQQINAF